MGSQMNQLTRGQNEGSIIQQLQDLSNRMDAPTVICAQARCDMLELALRDFKLGNQSVTAASIAAQFNKLAADFPTFPALVVIRQQVTQALARAVPPASATPANVRRPLARIQ